MKNNYVGELQEFEIATGHSAPTYIKGQVPVNVPNGKGVQLKFAATVRLSSGTEYLSSTSYVKYGHAKNDAAYVALCAERAVSRKDAPVAMPSNAEVLQRCRGVIPSVPADRVIYTTSSSSLRSLMARVLALETEPPTMARIVWHASDFETMARFATALQSLGIAYRHRSPHLSADDYFDVFYNC